MRLPECVRRQMIRLLGRDAAERAQTAAELDALAADYSEPPLPEALLGWLNDATGQMRWKRARPVAAEELADHLSDQYEAFRSEGMGEDEAAQATIREMGDAVEAGTRLDRAWRPRPDWVMLVLVLATAAAGLALQYILRQPFCAWMGISPGNSLANQLFYFAIGTGLLFLGYFMDYTILGRHIRLLYALWLAVGLFLAFSPWRAVYNGRLFYTAQWIWFFPVLFAGVLYSQRGRGAEGVRNCLLSLLGMWFLACIAPYISALGILTVVCCGMLVMAVRRGAFGRCTRGRLVLAVSPLLALLGYFLFLLYAVPHARERLALVFHPQADASTAGYQGSAIQYIMFGIPFAGSETVDGAQWIKLDGAGDWLLMSVKYLWGWTAVFLLLAAVLLLLAWGFRIARRQNGLLARSVCMGVMLTFALQAALYVLQNCGIIVFASHGLPLLSYGGIYLCQTMLLLGLLLSAQRSGGLERAEQQRPALRETAGSLR